jgi:hypothetical protein
MKNLKLLLLILLLDIGAAMAQTTCPDLNIYPMTKNQGSMSTFLLQAGYEEKAAQTYYYNGPGSLTQVRIYGSLPNGLSLPLNIVLYNVDANGRPASAIKTVSFTWYKVYNIIGYLDVNMGNIILSNDFAISLEIPSGTPGSPSFDVGYTGNGEGRNEDLASLAGTSTGNNWTSALNTFSKNGDFYLLPKMNNFVSAWFNSTSCAAPNATIQFTNSSNVSLDSMFNILTNPKYSGSNYLYSWDFGDNSAISHATSPQHTYAASGEYTITLSVTFQGYTSTCTDIYKKVISAGLKVSATNIKNVSCNGDYTGGVTASASGGVQPYMYSIDGINYFSTPGFSNLRGGQYTLYVHDSFGCVQTTSFTILQPSHISAVTWGSTYSTCGKSNGSVTVIATGGSGNLKYSIDGTNFQNSGVFNNIPAGHKVITIKDTMGCFVLFYIDVNDASGPVLKVTNVKNITCNNSNDGAISVTSTGGTTPVQYSIDGTNYQASGDFSALGPGTYGVIAKDANGCIDIITISIIQPSAITFSASTTPATCNGSSDGTIYITSASGGTGSYTYSIDSKTYQSGTTFSGLKAGNYTVYLRDASSCIVMANVSIKQPDQVSATTTVTNATCYNSNNGSIKITVTGGTAPYAYSIDGTHYQPVGSFVGLTAATYHILVRDANGCFNVAASATVTQPTEITASIATTNATCGNQNGQILAQASGGAGSGYKYSIDGGANFNTSGSFSNLKDSTYTLIIVDGNACPAAFIVTISSTNGPKISTINHTNVSCYGGFDGSITIGSVSGGTGNLSYSLDGFYWQSTGTFSSLPAGSYVVRVRDAVGCTGAAGITITEPSPIVITTSIANPTCHFSSTGSVTIYAAGGTGTMAYSINGINYQSSNVFSKLGAGVYMVYVRDAGHCMATSTFTLVEPPEILIMNTGILNVTCNGSSNGALTINAIGGTGTLKYSLDGINYQTGNSFNGLNGGLYTVFVKDANQCIVEEFARVNEPAPLYAFAETKDVSCTGGNNGAVILTPMGGTTPYRYQWSNFQITKDLFDARAGSYSVVITDANGCTYNASYTVSQPDKPLVVNGAIDDAHTGASDGSIKLTISGGTGFFSFHWSNGATTQDIDNLQPGQYTVIVMDANGCQVSSTFKVGTKTGIDNSPEPGLNVNLYPNPANNSVCIDGGSLVIERVTIMTIQGKIAINEIVTTSKPQINTSSLVNGIYFVNYSIGGVTYHQRLEIQR